MTILPLMILTSNSEVQRGVNAEPVFEYFPSEGHCGFLHISVIFTDKFDIKDPNKLGKCYQNNNTSSMSMKDNSIDINSFIYFMLY